PTPTPTPTPTPGSPTPTPFPATPIRASALVLRDDATPPIVANARTMRMRSAPHKGVPSGVTAPQFFSSSDPTLLGATGGGGTLTIYNPGGTEKVVLPLPAGRWLASGTFARPSYRYRDPKRESGPITSIAIVNGRLSLSGKGGALYSLANAPQGTMAVRLRLGSGVEFCAAAPAKAPATTSDTTSKFVGAPNSPPPAVCPPVP
ncbi:MAG: hypothetical protein AB1689_29215, partial [Thermodesulfobacteriota bacterium]